MTNAGKEKTAATLIAGVLRSLIEDVPGLRDAVVVVTITGGLFGALEMSSTPRPGRRIVRFSFAFDDILAACQDGDAREDTLADILRPLVTPERLHAMSGAPVRRALVAGRLGESHDTADYSEDFPF